MYAFPDMIILGLLDGQEWPTQDHRTVAINLAIGNGNVNSRDKMIEIVQAVLKVPTDRIRSVDYYTLRDTYGCPACLTI